MIRAFSARAQVLAARDAELREERAKTEREVERSRTALREVDEMARQAVAAKLAAAEISMQRDSLHLQHQNLGRDFAAFKAQPSKVKSIF